MKESFSRQKLGDVVTSRRSFLATATIGIGALITNEAVNAKETWDGIETENGIFLPVYEDHTNKITPDMVPKGVDIFFKESGAFFTLEEAETKVFFPDNKTGGALGMTPEVIRRLAQSKATLMLGDVKMPTLEAYSGILMAGAETFIGTAGGIKLLKNTEGQRTTRRRLLRGGLGMLSLWGVSNMGLFMGIGTSEGAESTRKVGSHIGHINSQMHPENTIEYIRSLIWTSKLLDAAKNFKEQNGRKAKIAYNVGVYHGNVEQFLQKGQGNAQDRLLWYPSPVLKSFVDPSGGLTDFSSYSLMKLPEDLDPASGDYQQRVKDIPRQRFIDHGLESKIGKRLDFII